MQSLAPADLIYCSISPLCVTSAVYDNISLDLMLKSESTREHPRVLVVEGKRDIDLYMSEAAYTPFQRQ